MRGRPHAWLAHALPACAPAGAGGTLDEDRLRLLYCDMAGEGMIAMRTGNVLPMTAPYAFMCSAGGGAAR